MAEPIKREITPEWKSIGGQLTDGALKVLLESELSKFLGNNAGEIASQLLGALFKLMGPIGVGFAKAIADAEDQAAPMLSQIAAAAASDLFGKPVSPDAFKVRGAGGVAPDVGVALGKGLVDTIKGTGSALEPSEEPAARYLGMIVNLALEGWYQGFSFEFLSSLVPYFDIGKLESFAELDDTLAQALGLGRLSRRVLTPYIDNLVVTPLEWKVNKAYTPKLLSTSDAVRMLTSGKWTYEQFSEELARQGYDPDRIRIILQGAIKRFTISDVDLLVRSGQWTQGEAELYLRYQGWDPSDATTALKLERLGRIATFERQLANAAIDAFADGRITRSDLIGWLDGNTIDSQEQAQLAEIADARRALRVKPLTSGEARALVKAGILSAIDYRRALEREGRDDEAIDALDLLLKHEISEQKAIDDLRAEQAAERQAERDARETERAKARAAADAARALARRGREADLERAVIRGRIPVERYAEVIAQQFDSDTVAILVDDVEQQREHYLADERRRQEAEQRAKTRQLDVGAIRQAVLRGVLTLNEFRNHPAVAALDAGDVEILARTLDAELADRALAKERKADVEGEAKVRGLDLAKYAQLVRRGLRTIADYRARVAELGYGPADVDAITELLELDLQDDAHERETRAAAENQAQAKGLSLEQLRRAVLTGVAKLPEFEKFLIEQRYTDDARRTLVAGLERELADVDAARARQQAVTVPEGAAELSLSELQRAARLGILSPSDYRARLLERGYDELDAEIAVEMLLREITSTQQARALRDATEREPKGIALSLGELARAVKASIKTIDDYRAALVAAGKTDDAVKTLVALLADEVAERKAAESRRLRIAERLAGAGLDLAAIEQRVIAGGISLDEYSQTLAAAGVAPAEVGILVGLLVARLETV